MLDRLTDSLDGTFGVAMIKLIYVALILTLSLSILAFNPKFPLVKGSHFAVRPLSASLDGELGYVKAGEINIPDDVSDEWELDCYSRPVIDGDGKKLWEVLITDKSGSFRYLQKLPGSMVNSRNLRKTVEQVIDSSPVRPKKFRFFRSQMLNMITIALKNLDVEVKASKCTHNLQIWLEEREEHIYPKMDGYSPTLRQKTIFDYESSEPDRLPDVLRAESYAFVALPAEVFFNGDISADNVGKGTLCPTTKMPKEGLINGIALFSQRADSIAGWMSGVEISDIEADLLGRELKISTDINKQYLLAPLGETQKKEARIFEKGKTDQSGYHFLSIQFTPESEEPEGFWLLRKYTEST